MTAQTILPANSVTASGYDVANSCRFDGSSSYMQKTLGAPTSAKKATFSLWFKTSDTIAGNGGRCLMSWGDDAGAIYVNETNDGQWEINLDNSDGLYKGTAGGQLSRDPAAWSHLCLIIDTTNDTANDRFQFFLNNVRVVFSANNNNNPDEDYDVAGLADGQVIAVGRRHSTTSLYYSGYMAEVCFIDGNNLAATNFGEVDEDSGIFKPIDVSGLTFGNNGFYLDFQASGNLGNDANGGTDLTESGLAASDQSTDTCTNNFATWNSLIKTTASLVEGNLKYTTPGSNPVFGSLSTIGVTAGKWYAELNYTSGSNHKLVLGVADETFQNGNTTASYDLGKSSTTSSIAYVVNTGDYRVNNSNTSWGSGGGDGQIINMAIDRDNGKIYFGVNGTWGNSSDPAAGSDGIPTTALNSSAWFWGITSDTSGTGDVGELNFGSPSYSESGGETDGNGYGNFAHAPPSGYYVLNSKNLSEYG